MATEEIHLNDALEGSGMTVVETDLGEYIIQLAGVTPSHIVAPAAHMRIEDISEVLQEKLDMQPTMDPEAMCSAARARLRKEFLSADMGISGCNFGIAETGTVCIATNEGNGRMVTSLPRVHVAIMGIEKLVPTVEDAFLQYQALCRSSTGQQFTVYLSMTSGPRKDGDTDGPEAFHVVLIDNGRSEILARGYGEALMCVRCGACLNVCPVYRAIGGHAYGSTYSGPIGAVISPLLQPDAVDVHKLPGASSLCGACSAVCPVKIDLPRLLLDLRADFVQQGATPWAERRAMRDSSGRPAAGRSSRTAPKPPAWGQAFWRRWAAGRSDICRRRFPGGRRAAASHRWPRRASGHSGRSAWRDGRLPRRATRRWTRPEGCGVARAQARSMNRSSNQ